MPQSSVFAKYLELYCLNLIIESSLLEAIKKDEINSADGALLAIKGESDFDRAQRIMALAKTERSDKKSLISIRCELQTVAVVISGYLSTRRSKIVDYTLEREGYKDRRYRFQLNAAGNLTARAKLI